MNNLMVSFSNAGEIDPRVWSTFGVSVKETDSPIGQFGTGLKYAIAVLLRHNRAFWIKSKGKEYRFRLIKSEIRGKEFHQIACNDTPLPFTTHLGGKWELWQAYRELFSNCLDEGGHLGSDGETVIYAELGDINHNEVFLDKHRKIIADSPECTVYAGSSSYLYFKGIRAQTISRQSLFTYDIKKADLTEDRTFKYLFEVDKAVSSAVIDNQNDYFVGKFLLETKGFYEEAISFDYAYKKPSEIVLKLVDKYRKDGIYMQKGLTVKAIDALGAAIFKTQEADSRQAKVIEKAKSFCSRIGYNITHPVLVSSDLGQSALAMANKKDMSIYLSDRVLDQGVKQVAATLIEENLHLSKGFSDLTYEMQNYLFDQIVTMGERMTGEIL